MAIAKRSTKKSDCDCDCDCCRPRSARPLTGYMYWLNKSGGRQILKKENPSASVTEIGKLAGAVWRGMSSAEKDKFTQAALRAFKAKAKK